MARTPLLTRLQSLARAFAYAERHGVSVSEAREGMAARRLSRRHLLGGLAAAAATLPVRPARAAMPGGGQIAIIGGGMAGLNAALTLQDAGVGCTIYEASDRVGGRMHSNTTSWEDGQVTERCGELIDTGHTTVLDLAARFGLPVDDLLAAELPGSSDTYYFDGSRYSVQQAEADFAPVYRVLVRDLLAAGYPTLYNAYKPAGAALDQLSVAQWIESRVPGGRASAFGQLLEVAYTIEYGLEATEQSSLNLIYLLGFQPQRGSLSLFGESDERYHVRGGNEQLPQAMAAALPASSIVTGTALEGIRKNGDGTYKLSLRGPGGEFSVAAHHVVLALPFSVLRRTDYSEAGFSAVKVTGIQQLGYGTNAKLAVQFRTRFWNQAGPYGVSNGASLADTGYQNTWEVTRAQPGASGILVDYTGGSYGASFRGNPNDPAVVGAYAQRFLGQLAPVLPAGAAQWNGRATLDVPARSPWLRGSYSCWKVGQYTLFSGSEGERSGNCHFAGEHCSTSYQGYMEGAAQEGQRAANEILSDYGIRRAGR